MNRHTWQSNYWNSFMWPNVRMHTWQRTQTVETNEGRFKISKLKFMLKFKLKKKIIFLWKIEDFDET